MEGEFKKTPFAVKVNIAGKQKDLALKADKLVNIFRQVVAAPQMLDDPRLADLFNQILEASGLSPIEMGAERYQRPPQQQMPLRTTEPIREMVAAVSPRE